MSFNKSYTLGEAEAHIAGMREAAHIADMHLHHEAANLIRNVVTVMMAGGMPSAPVLKPAEVANWYQEYRDELHEVLDGRAAYRAYEALKDFKSKKDFVEAPRWRFEAIPNCGTTTVNNLINLRDKIRNEKP